MRGTGSKRAIPAPESILPKTARPLGSGQIPNAIPLDLAHGLTIFLNSTAVDESFRRFSGHTQVNATDLRQLKYPSRTVLIAMGEWAMRQGRLTQQQIDDKLETLGT